MVEPVAEDEANENDAETPREPSLAADASQRVPPSPSGNHLSADPPRWRFVADAKKASGYSTRHAGLHVQGKTSEELAAKYVAPDVSLYKNRRERPEVGKLRLPVDGKNDGPRADVEVGRLKLSAGDGTPHGARGGVEKLEKKLEVGNESPELAAQKNEPTNSFNPGGAEEENGPEENGKLNGEAFVAVDSTHGEGDQADEEAMRGGANEDTPETLGGEKIDDSGVDESACGTNSSNRQRALYLLLLILFLLVVVLGVMLGRKNKSGEASAASHTENAAAMPEVSGPAPVAGLLIPPSASPSTKPSDSPSARPTAIPSSLPMASPSKQPSDSPSWQPTADPSNTPTSQPTDTPTRKPSPPPTLPPTNPPTLKPTSKPSLPPTPPPTKLPTLKPTCSIKLEPFNVCLAVNHSGSLCNGPTASLCIGCPWIPSVNGDTYCRDPAVQWSSCCSNFANVKQLATAIVNSLSNLPAEKRFSVVDFASNGRLVSGLSSTSQTMLTLGQLSYTGGLDDHPAGIKLCQQSFLSSPVVKRIIVLITDGETGRPSGVTAGSTASAAASAKGDGTFIISVQVPPDAPDTNEYAGPFLSSISSDGDVFDIMDYDMSKVVQIRDRVKEILCM